MAPAMKDTYRVTSGCLVVARGLTKDEASEYARRSPTFEVRPDAYSAADLAAVRAEVAHEDEIDAAREEYESDYASDPSGQS